METPESASTTAGEPQERGESAADEELGLDAMAQALGGGEGGEFPEQRDIHELSKQLDDLNTALDSLEKRNRDIRDHLVALLQSCKEVSQECKEVSQEGEEGQGGGSVSA